MNGELRQRTAGSAMLVPAPSFGREFEGALVGEICFDKSDATQFAAVDGLTNSANAAHQPRAVAYGNGDAVFFFERGNFQALFECAGDGLFRVDVLAGFGDFGGDRKVLLVGNGEDGAFDLAIREHGLQVRNRGDAGILFERGALLFGAAER